MTDFENAIHLLDTSYYNFGYIDNVGNIAFYESGEIPMRKDLAAGKIVGVPSFFVQDSALGNKNGWIPLKKIPFRSVPSVSNYFVQGYAACY